MLKPSLLISLFLLAFVLPLSAQEKDSTDIWEDWGDEDNTECTTSHGRDYGFMQFHSFGGKPTIELTYGNSNVGIKSFGKLSQRDFANVGSAELRLSYSRLEDYDDYIVRYRNRFFFVSNNSTDLVSKKGTASDISSDLWRFGFGTQDGYGYKIGSSAIVPYTSNSFVWSRVDWDLPEGGTLPGMTAEDQNRLDLFNNAFRFGSMTEGGVKLQIVPLFTLNAGYERSVIFPRYLVWKQLGSLAVEAAALGLADMFAGEVMDSSPAAGPIINFLLKSGVSYAVYQLRREKMNWPFNSAEPLTYDTWKIGMTFTF
ncbi:MAG: hypothetical protein ACM3UR_02315 [Bacteroidota bacterium]|jgi:hypothetical protein|nr:hypothetical protein [Ignavibacteria bacterium]MCU7498487.1 hypothetical protein [Ignavibacteria bacterium]MCU7512615.1 hypothetical protein [Ignavibacteria bacterium]MCU7521223.1 hypothetical protein [Ignavibacteria bacterium]MCU7525053.1 hypothetical protein [Ignavibacteria bacterium]